MEKPKEATNVKEHEEEAPAEEDEAVEEPEEIKEIAIEGPEEVEEESEEEEARGTEEAEEVKDLSEEVKEEPEEEMEIPEEAEGAEEVEEVKELAEEEEIAEEVKEEAEEEEKPEIVDERIYTIPLSRAWIAPRRKRAPRAMRLVRSYIERHMKIGAAPEEEGETERLVISNEVNEKLWSRGIQKPPRRVRVRAAKDVEGTITVYLAEGE